MDSSEHRTLAVWSISLGCPKNRVDTERCLGSLGCSVVPVEDLKDAELVFINTCAFIEPAVRESLKTIFETLEDLKEAHKSPFVVVAGCLVGRYGKSSLCPEIPEVDLWLESKDLPQWPRLLQKALFATVCDSPGRLLSTGPSYAWLKIGEGCRHSCAFCTIPMIRGKAVSAPKEFLVREARSLVAQGVREIDLVAQDVTAWGADIKSSLRELLPDLASIPDLLWLRLLYLYPTGLTEDLLRLIRDIGDPILPYFDVPLQHAHPDILREMGRPFAEDPARCVDRIRALLPDAVLRTTVIVGFPGETEEHFARLVKFVGEGHFLHLGVFCYQAEDGTRAQRLPNQVPAAVAQQRRDTLMQLQQELSRKKLLAHVGSTLPVLVDAHHPEWPSLYTGRVWFQAPEVDGVTYISGPGVTPGAVCRAEIVESIDYDLTALSVE